MPMYRSNQLKGASELHSDVTCKCIYIPEERISSINETKKRERNGIFIQSSNNEFVVQIISLPSENGRACASLVMNSNTETAKSNFISPG